MSSAHSSVPHKHNKGGQSKERFARIRDNEIVHWFKRVNEYLDDVPGPITLAVSCIYKKRVIKYLSSANAAKIVASYSPEYMDSSGVYQFINKIKA